MGKKKNREQQAVADPTRSKRNAWIFVSAIIIAVVLSYSPAWNGRPVSDDDAYIPRVELRTLDGLAKNWATPGTALQYYPLV
jgi:hypothetical protein